MKQTAIDRDTNNATRALNTYLLLMAFGMLLWIVAAIWLLAPFNSNKDHYETAPFNHHTSTHFIKRPGNPHLAFSAAYLQVAGTAVLLQPAGYASTVRNPHQSTKKPTLLRKA